MMYVKLRSALSICDTALAFLTMKSLYMSSHFGGIASASGTVCETCFTSDAMLSVWYALPAVSCGPGLGVRMQRLDGRWW